LWKILLVASLALNLLFIGGGAAVLLPRAAGRMSGLSECSSSAQVLQ